MTPVRTSQLFLFQAGEAQFPQCLFIHPVPRHQSSGHFTAGFFPICPCFSCRPKLQDAIVS